MAKCPDTPLPEVAPTWAEAEITASRFQSATARPAPELSPDGRISFTLSCDGWVQKLDTTTLQVMGRVRAGLNARNMAISADGNWLAVANTLPATLVILSTNDLSLGMMQEITDDNGLPSRASIVRSNPLRQSFVMPLQDAPKIWEVFYGPNPPAVGFVHDWRIEGPAPHSIRFPIRKITIPVALNDFVFDLSYEYIIATPVEAGRQLVVDLVIGHVVAEF